MHDQRQCIHSVAVDQHVEAGQVGHLETVEAVFQRGIATADRLQTVKEVQHHLVHRQLVDHLHLGTEEVHVHLYATLLDTEGDDVAQVLLRYQDGGLDDRLAHFLDQGRVRHA